MKCRFGPRKGLKVPCTHCGEVLDRDDLIISLYKVGVSVPELASVFNLSDTRIHQVIRWWSLGKKNPNRKLKV